MSSLRVKWQLPGIPCMFTFQWIPVRSRHTSMFLVFFHPPRFCVMPVFNYSKSQRTPGRCGRSYLKCPFEQQPCSSQVWRQPVGFSHQLPLCTWKTNETIHNCTMRCNFLSKLMINERCITTLKCQCGLKMVGTHFTKYFPESIVLLQINGSVSSFHIEIKCVLKSPLHHLMAQRTACTVFQMGKWFGNLITLWILF